MNDDDEEGEGQRSNGNDISVAARHGYGTEVIQLLSDPALRIKIKVQDSCAVSCKNRGTNPI